MSHLALAITRADVADYVLTLVYVYLALIFVKIVVSWVPTIPYHRWLSAFLTFVDDVTGPYLRLFRRFVPMVKFGAGGLDLSPMIGTIVLLIVGPIVADLIRG
jgi:YggT family protein